MALLATFEAAFTRQPLYPAFARPVTSWECGIAALLDFRSFYERGADAEE